MAGGKEKCLWRNVCKKSNGLNMHQWIEKANKTAAGGPQQKKETLWEN